MAKLSFSSLFVENVDKMAEFYGQLFGFEGDGFVTPTYRGLDVGGSTLGLSSGEVYEILKLPRPAKRGINTFLTFDVEDRSELQTLTEKAKSLGASIVREPFETSYGWYQSVLLDPEGNAFRLNVR